MAERDRALAAIRQLISAERLRGTALGDATADALAAFIGEARWCRSSEDHAFQNPSDTHCYCGGAKRNVTAERIKELAEVGAEIARSQSIQLRSKEEGR